MKKFLSVMLLTVGIFIVGQAADMSKATAADVYACTDGGVEYYVYNYESFAQDQYRKILQYNVFVKGVSGGKVVKLLIYGFYPKPAGVWEYAAFNQSTRARIFSGRVSGNSTAQAILDVVTSGKFNEHQKQAAQVKKHEDEELTEQEARAEELLEEAFECFNRKQYTKAVELQKQAIAVAPDYVSSYFELALLYSRLNRHREGINLLTDAIVKRGLRHHRLYFARGEIYRHMGNLTEAGKDYSQALNVCNNDRDRRQIQAAQQKLWQRSF